LITKADLLWKGFVKFFIYKCRTQHKIPRFPAAKFEFEGMMKRHCMRNIHWYMLNVRFLYQQ
jgi:hypothetical protein